MKRCCSLFALSLGAMLLFSMAFSACAGEVTVMADDGDCVVVGFAAAATPRTLFLIYGERDAGETYFAWERAATIEEYAVGAGTTRYQLPKPTGWGGESFHARIIFANEAPRSVVEPLSPDLDLSRRTVVFGGRITEVGWGHTVVRVRYGAAADALDQTLELTTADYGEVDKNFDSGAQVIQAPLAGMTRMFYQYEIEELRGTVEIGHWYSAIESVPCVMASLADAYVQSGLVANWDAETVGEAQPTAWVDRVGGHSFALTRVTAERGELVFDGTGSGLLSAEQAAATFGELANGTLEVALSIAEGEEEDSPLIPVEYLEGQKDFYFDTGYKINVVTELRFKFSDVANGEQWTGAFGDYEGEGVKLTRFIHNGSNEKAWYAYFMGAPNSGGGKQFTTSEVGAIIEGTMSRSGITIIGGTTQAPTIVGTENPNTLRLMNPYSDTTRNKSVARIYYFQILENGTLIHDYVPCKRKRDDAGVFYDRVTGEVLEKIGEGTPVCGGVASGVKLEFSANATVLAQGENPYLAEVEGGRNIVSGSLSANCLPKTNQVEVSIVYTNGAPQAINYSGQKLTRFTAAAGALVGGEGAVTLGVAAGEDYPALKGRVRAIRLYNRQLTDEEMCKNQAVDRMRGSEGGVAAEDLALLSQSVVTISSGKTAPVIHVAGVGIGCEAYVQEGLVAQWDGIENCGRGVHANELTVWRDLVNGNDVPLPSWVRVQGAGLYSVAEERSTRQSLTNIRGFTSNKITLEMVVRNAGWRTQDKNWTQHLLWTPFGSLGYKNASLSNGLFVYSPNGKGGLVLYSWLQPGAQVTEVHTLSLAATDGSESDDVYFDGMTASGIASGGWTEPANGDWSFFDNRDAHMEVYALRIYQRRLTAEEVRQNAEVDRQRFPFDGSRFAVKLAWDETDHGETWEDWPHAHTISEGSSVIDDFVLPPEALAQIPSGSKLRAFVGAMEEGQFKARAVSAAFDYAQPPTASAGRVTITGGMVTPIVHFGMTVDGALHDFVPCRRRSDGEGVFYDRVTGTVLPKNGSGKANLGPTVEGMALPDDDLEMVEYIEGHRDFYFNTGYVPNPQTELKFKFSSLANGTQYAGAFGAYQDEDSQTTRIIHDRNNESAFLVYHMAKSVGGGNAITLSSFSAGGIVEGTMTHTYAILNGQRISVTQRDAPDRQVPIGLMNTATAAGVYDASLQRIYYFRIYESGTTSGLRLAWDEEDRGEDIGDWGQTVVLSDDLSEAGREMQLPVAVMREIPGGSKLRVFVGLVRDGAFTPSACSPVFEYDEPVSAVAQLEPVIDKRAKTIQLRGVVSAVGAGTTRVYLEYSAKKTMENATQIDCGTWEYEDLQRAFSTDSIFCGGEGDARLSIVYYRYRLVEMAGERVVREELSPVYRGSVCPRFMMVIVR